MNPAKNTYCDPASLRQGEARAATHRETTPQETLTDGHGLPNDDAIDVATEASAPPFALNHIEPPPADADDKQMDLARMDPQTFRRLRLLRLTAAALTRSKVSTDAVLDLAVDTLTAAVAEARHERDTEFMDALAKKLKRREVERYQRLEERGPGAQPGDGLTEFKAGAEKVNVDTME